MSKNASAMRKNIVLVASAVTLAVLIAAAAVVGAAMVYGGLYSVAATEQHYQPTFTLLNKALRQSVRLRARAIEPPPLDDEAMVRQGAACFRDSCVQCHGAPGVAPDDIGKSMQPPPGPLVDARRHWSAREMYWITRQGIRMSGMPSWERRLTEGELWAVVAFLQRLPDLNSQQFLALSGQAPTVPACGTEAQAQVAREASNAGRGKDALFHYACRSCHIIPGVTGGPVHVGPSLEGIAGRATIAGKLRNTPENMALWLRETQQVKHGTAMPQLGVTQQDARDIAAYLATLH